MHKFKFPICKGKSNHWPKKAVCPICRRNKVMEPHSMAILMAGALLMNRTKDSGGPSDNMDGFLSLHWHGAHDGGKGKDAEIGCTIDIIQDCVGGQAELYFCSTKCLRQFLNCCVDELEKEIAEKRTMPR